MKKLVLVGLALGVCSCDQITTANQQAKLSAFPDANQQKAAPSAALDQATLARQAELYRAALARGEAEPYMQVGTSAAQDHSALVRASRDENYVAGLDASIKQDYVTAVKIWLPLAERGNVFAQSHLALVYTMGQGVPQDFSAAIHWYTRAADQRDLFAQQQLALEYAYGIHVPKDYSAAANWYRKAADQGSEMAQGSLGGLYENGQGVPQDYVQAHKWYNLAAASASDSEIMKTAATNRDAVAAKMTPAQIAEAQRLASEWKPN